MLRSIFAPYGFNPTHINPDFSLALFDIRLSVGDQEFTSATDGCSQIGDLGGPGGYDAAWWFNFGGWTLSISGESMYDAITSAEAAQWEFPKFKG